MIIIITFGIIEFQQALQIDLLIHHISTCIDLIVAAHEYICITA